MAIAVSYFLPVFTIKTDNFYFQVKKESILLNLCFNLRQLHHCFITEIAKGKYFLIIREREQQFYGVPSSYSILKFVLGID